MKINVQDNKTFKWTKKNNIYAIGYILKNDEILKNEKLIDFFENINDKEILKRLKQIDGRFTIIIEQKEQVIIISDILRSFPIFYRIKENELVISNNIDDFENKNIKESNIIELLSAGYVTGKDTLYNEIYQNESAKVIIINKKDFEVKEEKYFVFKQEDKIVEKDEKEIFKELDKKYDNAIKRLIKYANGKKIIIPLSRWT